MTNDRWWYLGSRVVRYVVPVLAVVATALFAQGGETRYEVIAAALAFISVFITLWAATAQEQRAEQAREKRLERAEEQFLENPEKPQLAWDLARTKLENYLDRNLSQVRSIYWLTVIVMLCGFGFVLYGLFEASQNPEKLPVSIVASASGVLISFIGGSFLLIYRSILAQSKDYVTVLERINAVGMAVQVINSIPDRSAERKDTAMADLANALLGLYSTLPRPNPTVAAERNS